MKQRQIKTGVKVKSIHTNEVWEVLARNYNEVLLIFRGIDGESHQTIEWDKFEQGFEII